MYKCCLLLLVAVCASTDTLSTDENLSSVFFRLLDRGGSFMDFSLSNVTEIVPHLNLSKTAIIYIHGYGESVADTSVTPITNGLLEYTTENIIALDYRKIAGLQYLFSVEQVPSVAVEVAKSIEKMVEAGVRAESIYIIGHSLGAQLAGYIGRNLTFNLTRITGLDPAGPLYNVENSHLSASDAKFVDIIHTDAGTLGIFFSTGSVDFHPNYGTRQQPGCYDVPLLNGNVCSHRRSWAFFIESLKNRNAFVAVKCSNALKFISGLCNRNEKAIMGYYVSPQTRGIYYLRTGSREPYGLGPAGAVSFGG